MRKNKQKRKKLIYGGIITSLLVGSGIYLYYKYKNLKDVKDLGNIGKNDKPIEVNVGENIMIPLNKGVAFVNKSQDFHNGKESAVRSVVVEFGKNTPFNTVKSMTNSNKFKIREGQKIDYQIKENLGFIRSISNGAKLIKGVITIIGSKNPTSINK